MYSICSDGKMYQQIFRLLESELVHHYVKHVMAQRHSYEEGSLESWFRSSLSL